MNGRYRALAWSSLAVIAIAAALGRGEPTASAGRTPVVGRPDHTALSRLIDEAIERRLAEAKLSPAPLADDAEFLRRVYLDITGVIPAEEKVAAFLDDRDPGKRARLIDELLDNPKYGRSLADRWEDLLMVRDSTNKRLKSEPLIDWLAGRFNKNTPWDVLVNELLTANGTQEENGAATFFIALRTPDKLNDQVCRLFLGVQLQCAQCHDHPFTNWKRSDYWSMASFFSKVRAGGKKVGLANRPAEVVNESGEGKKAARPDSALDLPPKFLGGARPELKAGAPLRPVLARWLTAPDNPYFARAMVNRTWAQFFGRGLVNPVDSINSTGEASHPEMFEALARRFAADGFDLKHLIRGLCNSRAYQRTSAATTGAAGLDSLYGRMAVKPLSPEQLYDSLVSVLGSPDDPRSARKAARTGVGSPRDKFVAFFRPTEGSDPSEYSTGIPQVLQLMNSPQTNKVGALLKDLSASGSPPEAKIDRLYLVTLARRPTAPERERLLRYLKSAGGDTRVAYSDILWVLLNSSEFALNH
jgi:hypothetical protein